MSRAPAAVEVSLLLTPLSTLDHARALVDCVYDVHGLTYHQELMYEPDAWFELNREGHVLSLLAIDEGRVVGHIALVRPFFEVQDAEGPITDASMREIGLDLVVPSHRGRNVRSKLAHTIHALAAHKELSGLYDKCVTHALSRQRTALAHGARPVVLKLGAIPRWIVEEGDEAHAGQPLSTVTFFAPVLGDEQRTVYMPPGVAWMPHLIAGATIPRHRADPVFDRVPAGRTRMISDYSNTRHSGRIFVTETGEDLLERVDKAVGWLVRGHMKHVSIYLPADCPRVAASMDEMMAVGLVPAGWLPKFYRGGRDAYVMQASPQPHLDTNRVHVEGPVGARLKSHIVAAWRAAPQLETGQRLYRAA